jgi:predicted enzyme related to lactoylglutathione lyase
MTLVLNYIELAVGDVARATDFYSKAMGWTFNDYGPEYAGIQDPRNPGEEFGGLNGDGSIQSGAGGVVPLARTDDADQAFAAVKAAGGTIVVDLHEYPGGRRFMFADPWGNVIGVFELAH